MIYNDMILETVSPSLSKYNDMKENLDHDILNKVSEEFNNFNKIMESIFILSENNILNEGAKLDKIKETILHTLERIKAFFIKVGSVIIQFIKNFKNKAVSKTIKENSKIKVTKLKNLDADTLKNIVEERLNRNDDSNIAAKLNKNTKNAAERINELLNKLKIKQSNINESSILTESDNIDFSKIDKNVYSELFYIDIDMDISNTDELIRYYNESLEGFSEYLDWIKKYSEDKEGAKHLDARPYSGGSSFSIFNNAKRPSYFRFDINLESSPCKMTAKMFDHRYFYTVLQHLGDKLDETDKLLEQIDISKIETIVNEIEKDVSILNKQATDNNYTYKDVTMSAGGSFKSTEVLKDFTNYATAAKDGLVEIKKYIDQINISRQILINAIQMHDANMSILISASSNK